jgi:hypothetical protein
MFAILVFSAFLFGAISFTKTPDVRIVRRLKVLAAVALGRAMTIDEGVAYALGGSQRSKPKAAVKPVRAQLSPPGSWKSPASSPRASVPRDRRRVACCRPRTPGSGVNCPAMLAGESHGRVLLGNSMRADSPVDDPATDLGDQPQRVLMVLAELISWPSARPSAQGHLEVRAIKPCVVGGRAQPHLRDRGGCMAGLLTAIAPASRAGRMNVPVAIATE